MSIELELQHLTAAVDRLTAAVTGHARTRLEIFERAGQEALAAIPLTPEELAAPPTVNDVIVDVDHALRHLADAGDLADSRLTVNEAVGEIEAAMRRLAETSKAAESRPAAIAPPAWVVRPGDCPAVPLEAVKAAATELLRSGQRERLQDVLQRQLGVGTIDQLDAAQRVRFLELVTTPVEVRPPAGATTHVQAPRDEPPPAEVPLEEAVALARHLIDRGAGGRLRDLLVNHFAVRSVDQLTALQRVEFARLALSEAA